MPKDWVSQLEIQITFDIQGIPIEFEVTATRRIQWETMQMNFFLVAKAATLLKPTVSTRGGSTNRRR